MSDLDTNPAPTTEHVEPAGHAGEPAAETTGAAVAKANSDAERARRKIERLERERDDAIRKAEEFAQAQKTEAERERDEAIKRAVEQKEAEWSSRLRSKELEAAVLVELSEKVGAGAAKMLVPSVLAAGEIESTDDIPDAVGKVLDALPRGHGGPGQGGAPSPGMAGKNPFAKGQENLTEQVLMIQSDPDKAKRLAAAAGVTIPGF